MGTAADNISYDSIQPQRPGGEACSGVTSSWWLLAVFIHQH